MKSLLVSILLVFCFSSLLSEARDSPCWVSYYDSKKDSWSQESLKPSGFDPDYDRVEIGNYSVGADKSYFKEGGVGLIILNNKTDESVYALAGFVGQRAELKKYIPVEGKKDVISLKCVKN